MTDHKTVGLQYAVTSLIFLFAGFVLMLLMRWQLAWPGQPLPSWLAPMVGDANAPAGIMLPEFYNQLVAMHGTVMIFLAGDAVLLAARALPTWEARMREPSASGDTPLEVRVQAEQFAWHIHYPGPDRRFGRSDAALISAANPLGIDRSSPDGADDIGLTNVLVLPIDRAVVVQLTSRDVVHSFTLPEMRVKQDATPGFVSRTWFTPVKEGTWEIGCSQLCGLGHYRMRGEYRVVSQEAWVRWITDEVERLR